MARSSKKESLEVLNPDSAGIDIGSDKHFVSVPEQKSATPIRTFGATTKDLDEIVKWLISLGIKDVAMESTGIYWIPLYDMLEANGIKVCLVNARHLKNVSGRKTDVSDCEWLRKLHSYGLLNSSFIPDDLTRMLRSYVRQRLSIEVLKAKDLTQIGMVLHKMNIKLHCIVSELNGVTAMTIIRLIADGENRPEELIKHWTPQMKVSKEVALRSLEGNYKEENLFVLRQYLSSYDFHKSQMLECDAKIEEVLQQIAAIEIKKRDKTSKIDVSKKKMSKKPRKNQYTFDCRLYLKSICGVDLCAVDGFEASTVITLLAEVGTDLSKFPTPKHFVSWLRLCPNPKKTGGKVIGSKKNTTSNRASNAFRLCARSLYASKCYLGEYYRRIAFRRGSGVANKALARKLAILFYTMITQQIEYKATNICELDKRTENKMFKNLQNKAKRMGYKIVKDSA